MWVNVSATRLVREADQEIRGFVREKVVPLERELFRGNIPALEAGVARLREEVRDHGWWAPQAPRDIGGLGYNLVTYATVSEWLGWSPLGHYVFGAQAPDAGNIEILAQRATDEQRQTWLMPLVRGGIRSCFGMTEPDRPGSDATDLGTTAVVEGDHWLLNGRKWFTSGQEGSSFCIVMAITEPDAPQHARASLIIVPSDVPGYHRVRNIPVMGQVGGGWFSHSEIEFVDCRVPLNHLLGGRGEGFRIAQERLGPGRIHHCMRWIGVAERTLDEMCRHVTSREFNAGRRLSDLQVIQNWIAECRAEIDASRLYVLDTADRMDRQGTRGARESISAIKFHVAGMLDRVLDRAVQAMGARGMTDDTVVAWYYRQERAARIYDGPDEVHKMVVARRVLAAYA